MKVKYKAHSGSDLMVVDAARVSFDKSSQWICKCGGEKCIPDKDYFYHCAECGEGDKVTLSKPDRKLINYLADHQHHSPFNHCFITMHVEAPLFVARQLVKHEYMPWNEVSGRYVTFEPEFHMPKSFRKKAVDKKQGSGKDLVDNSSLYLKMIFEDSHISSFNAYQSALRIGLCEEQARELLPLDLMTQWYWSGTLGAWAKMYGLRSSSSTQVETKEVAMLAGAIVSDLYPVSWDALANG
jgi:thymidylate synthase (FAD)